MSAPVRFQIAPCEDHDIGARKLRLLERSLDCYLTNLRNIECSMDIDKREHLDLARVVSEVRTLRDQVSGCFAVHIIPDEE